jgi:hypothetical protein
MWSDNETSTDLLGFQHLSDAVKSIVTNEKLLPATIGVFGDWGSGKSSLIRMIESELEEDEGIVVLSFNGWLFEGHEDAKTALMGTVLEELLTHRKFLAKASDEVKKLGGQLLKRVNWLKLASATGKLALAAKTAGLSTLLMGLWGGGDLVATGKELFENADLDLDDVKEIVKEKGKKGESEQKETKSLRKSIREFRKDFSELLKKTDIKTLVIVIDDLDRCLPENVIETLEAIKLFLFVERTAFILGADEELVRYAVRKRFPEFPGDRREVGISYLEKLVQFPVRVPPLGRAEVETYLGLLFATISDVDESQLSAARKCVTGAEPSGLTSVNFDLEVAQTIWQTVPPELAERLTLTKRIAPILGPGMNGNPRQCKRFLNMLVMRLKMGASRKVQLQQRVLVKLMLLEYFRPEFFKQLAGLQAVEDGKPRELGLLESAAGGETGSDEEPRAKISHPDIPALKIQEKGQADPRDLKPAAMPETTRPVLSAALELWLTDTWTSEWLRLDPRLADVDLRPYFFFSRDMLGGLDTAGNRLSEPAQRVLVKLLSESEAVRRTALKEGEGLSASDSAALFEALTTRVRQEEDPGRENSALAALFEWTAKNTHLRPQIVPFLLRLPETGLPVSAATKLLMLCQNTDAEKACGEILERWGRNTANQQLAKAAQSSLTRLTKKKV